MSPNKSTGFKPCGECHRQMSVTDPHLVCLWCLGSGHDLFRQHVDALKGDLGSGDEFVGGPASDDTTPLQFLVAREVPGPLS